MPWTIAHPLPTLSFQNNLALYSKLNSFSFLVLFFQLTCHLNSTNENDYGKQAGTPEDNSLCIGKVLSEL